MSNKSQKLGQYSLDNRKSEIVELNKLIDDNEFCRVIVSGTYSKELSVISITNKRLIIIRKKLFSSDVLKDLYNIDDITKFVYDKGFATIKLEITINDELIKITNISSLYLDIILNCFNNENIVKLSKKENDKILKEVNEEIKRKEFERIMASNPTISKTQSVKILSKNQQKKQYEKERLEQLKKEKIPYCPKCHSTVLTHHNKKLSVGRAVTGGVLFGGVGAVLGGLTSKKGYVKCLNCGHKWKL